MQQKNPGNGNRRLIPIGGSIGVTLPAKFLRDKGWKAGDRVGIVFDDIAVIIRPKLSARGR
jgi:antitoxin component of MazEF toxin-antitoxin module